MWNVLNCKSPFTLTIVKAKAKLYVVGKTNMRKLAVCDVASTFAIIIVMDNNSFYCFLSFRVFKKKCKNNVSMTS